MHESQMEFAAHCGISTEALSLLEREQSDPKLSTIQKVAAYADRTVPTYYKRNEEWLMHCVYKMIVTKEQDEQGRCYIGYGIEASGTERQLLQRVPDLFMDRDRGEQFVNLCNIEEVDIIHLFEVIDNALAE